MKYKDKQLEITTKQCILAEACGSVDTLSNLEYACGGGVALVAGFATAIAAA